MSKIEIQEQTQNTIQLLVSPPYIANSLRRALLSEIETYAIEFLYIEKNTSVIPDELLSHRLGLLPIKRVKNSSLPSEECNCTSYCSKCSIEFKLNIVNENSWPIDVTAKAFNDTLIDSDLVIVKLGSMQSLKLKAIAKKGRGRKHAKFSVVSAIGYEDIDENTIKMDVEVIENTYSGKEAVLEALKILRDKVKLIEDELEAEI